MPEPLGHEVIDFARGDHGLHELQGFGRDGKVGKAGGKARDAQDAHGVFGKGGGDVAQHLVAQVLLAVVGVVQLAVGRFGDGVDGEVAPGQVLL